MLPNSNSNEKNYWLPSKFNRRDNLIISAEAYQRACEAKEYTMRITHEAEILIERTKKILSNARRAL